IETKSHSSSLSMGGFRDFCVNYNILYDNTIKVYEVFKENESWNSKLLEQKKLLAEQVRYLGRMVKDVAQDIDINPIFNEELVELLTKELKNRRIDVAEVTAIELEKNDLEILLEMNSPVNSKFRMDKIKEIISKALGFPMTYDFSFGNLKAGDKNFKLVKTSRFTSMTSISRAPNSENLVSGDNYTFGETNNISFLA